MDSQRVSLKPQGLDSAIQPNPSERHTVIAWLSPATLFPPLGQPSNGHWSTLRWLPAILTAVMITPTLLAQAPASWGKEQAVRQTLESSQQDGEQSRLAIIETLSRKANGGQENPIPSGVVPQLIEGLHDTSFEVRLRSIDALMGIGTGAEDAILPLVDILQDPNQPVELRRQAVKAIQSIYAGLAIDDLDKALQDSDRVVRSNAAGALGSIEEKSRQAVPALIGLVRDDPYSEVRASAAEVIARIDPANREVLTTLNLALQDRSWRVRRSAADGLARLAQSGKGVETTVPNLLTALENKNSTLRTSAATTLGYLGPSAKSALPDLKKALLNNDNPYAQGQAARAIGKIGTDNPEILRALIVALGNKEAFVRDQALTSFHELIDKRIERLLAQKTVNPKELAQTASLLSEAQQAVDANEFSSDQKEMLLNSLKILQAKQVELTLINTFLLNPYLWAVVSFLLLQLGLFWLRPLWLLKIDEAIDSWNLKLPLWGTEVSPQSLIFLKFHPRVLDAWVSRHIQSFQEEFQKIENVEARKVFIPSPATINGRTLSAITNQDLDSSFSKPILIWGEGGVGKTSLACQIAAWAMADHPEQRICKHRMLPIFLEEDLECNAEECQQALLDAVLGQLRLLTREETPISQRLLETLLRRRRIMVITDHLSEMNEITRKAINPDSPKFPINALVVTSRQRDILGQINKLTIKPLRIMGNRLSSFMEAYLAKQGKRELFTDPEFFDACSHLSRMVGQREVTAMLATLYAKQMISAKVEAAQDILTPASDNIPDLMLSYMNYLNKELGDKKTEQDAFDDRTVHKDAMAVAWECLQELFRPSVISRETAIATLAKTWGDKAEAHLHYLEDRLMLIQTIGASEDQIRFTLDPLAEYLAALHLVDLYDGNEQQWQDFLTAAEAKPAAPASITGFLAAIEDCWETRAKVTKITPATLARFARMQSHTAASAPAPDPVAPPSAARVVAMAP
ncbi:HEAT repeat domain-containing protein [Cyanobium sp. FGCU-52]|nr:HEAT repeat domain-containing protein [Cyanobium sp. FGCU52]